MDRELPVLIQGGMGIAISGWRLAKAVAQEGHLGVVSGTAIDVVIVRRLQLGDEGGHVRRALAALPIPGAGQRIIDRYFIADGKPDDARFKKTSMKRHLPSQDLEELLVASTFVEVYLAREGHDGLVGINYLEKLQAPILPSLYGAMLAGVHFMTMGAGIPKTIPAILDKLAVGLPVDMRLDVKGATADDDFRVHFDPAALMGGSAPELPRPTFLAIVSSHVLAIMLATKTEVPPDGFIIEAATAGGHNAPPRGKQQLTDEGEPIYGARDLPDLAVFRELGIPFWLAGNSSSPEGVLEALAEGAAGIQVGTAFATCEESDLAPDLKQRVLDLIHQGEAAVFTDPLASPSGFPFKVVQLEGSLSDADVYASRERAPCELGYLRTAYRTDDGKLAWRCPADSVELYLRTGGSVDDTVGRKCLCNALMANIGLNQIQSDGTPELALVTAGNELSNLARFIPPDADSYTAADVIRHLLPDS